MDRFPAPWTPTDPPSAARLNSVLDFLRPLSNMTGGGATQVFATPDGTTIYTPEQPLVAVSSRRVIRIEGFSRTFAGDSAAFALPGGYYWGFVQTGTATTFPATNGGPDFNAATYYTDRDTTPVIVYNLLESGLVASHSLAAGTRLPCDDIREVTDVAANGSNYPVSNGMTFALYRFYGYSLGCL